MTGSSGIYWEVHGEGTPLCLGYPVTASPAPNEPGHAALRDYLDLLTDRYRVLVMDYANGGKSAGVPAGEMTAHRVCSALLGIADAAGFRQFAWWGFSWGAVIGLQLASRSDRVSALVCGGWPPLGGPYVDLLGSTRTIAAMGNASPMDARPYVTFYESVQGWPEATAVGGISCPRMAFFGTADEVDLAGVKVPVAKLFQSRRDELERQGWNLAEFAGRDHSLWLDAKAVVPVVRPFLDSHL
jgi:pimeloyl-ACP methyl ester carboxylesterase